MLRIKNLRKSEVESFANHLSLGERRKSVAEKSIFLRLVIIEDFCQKAKINDTSSLFTITYYLIKKRLIPETEKRT